MASSAVVEVVEQRDPGGLRRARGITLKEIQCSTLIALHFLEAIEAEEFTKLPGGVYGTSYIRQYAREIGYDEGAMLSRYYEQTQPEPAPEKPSSRSRISQWLREHQPHFFEYLAGRHKTHYPA